jgi:hypothetical protein
MTTSFSPRIASPTIAPPRIPTHTICTRHHDAGLLAEPGPREQERRARPVHLTLSGLPPRVSATFSPNDTTGSASTLTISTTKAVKTATYTFTVTGISCGVTHALTGRLTVKPN